MATIRDICEQAWRLLGSVAEDEPMTADQAATGLFHFNAMMNGLEIHGAEPGHTDQTLDSQSALPARFTEAMVRVLASRLAPLSPVRVFDARRYEDTLRAQFLNIEPVRFADMRPYRWAGQS